MRLYFADTWYFIAIADRLDQDHRTAAGLERSIRSATLVTHDGVLMEMLAYFSAYGARTRDHAAANVRRALATIVVFDASRPRFLAGLGLYEKRRDKEYSVVDCMSMELMREHGITHVLTNDHHFEQEGFTLLNE